MSALFDLTGLTAVVTGARRGIGLGYATALAEAGADIIAVSARQEASGSAVERAVTGFGRRCTCLQADFADPAAVNAVVERILDTAQVDILFNNAGVISRFPAVEYSDAEFARLLQVNLGSAFTLARELGRGMLDRGWGKIVFTASLLSYQGGVFVPAYTASKHGVAGLTQALANEWAGRGVNVNAIVPGYIATDNTRALRDDPERSASILERIPAGRWGRPSDLGGAAVFLASHASDYVNGIALPVDGGWLGR
ncbi:SDR family oxidoreductase [Propionibacterium australiense]|uniref:SDR family oxidoreductase n=1 Tax=Propionibacterium australiense TaxID=119981 RepID=A0A383S6D5_9ACTN|nr:SDR family oxidoreductase [Propionibacterium australiense]RLP10023.1 SDR family oxidoreductase [Propionibacterium australiense]RLP11399.1 SDR family oxidoreductase [Propionibacterium australiense]SYZ32939.1 Short-chain dehydrogenase/reductase, conserved site [Propionibacterium australiense]VEH92391.1 2-dehydro-3-deoxy-D-gluconate 5-dehydrogenase [Propionibacterium australiense]